ncbi:putative Lipoprotein localization factors LolAB [Thiomonas arsenitoxydans]|uniref:Lipoprotein localization factors LolAB n=1 Tax=Thiomonas arsenitoxydans (strain DSM 22701 / CIP 110005 / 3As) TaxID=426114 RepID=D6CVA3_THIA3|nr:LolA-related protein [Thiomonas arsenitoxydans]CAZ89222.1 putative Lipoprotein localization factors LolAB [Thiomonas arsenitoxydans]CQR34407.1 putative Lipoprotein localization factors LolAB [Thiomonas arsenitoxydans]CQR35069.1 putative Lipoprotein localization factors LolAB [Thiomonas arsenitoxydans]CQR37286.1 putative Lipoprotein localization factors LolAB [Thiomonas arsenitoxydans]CQR37458.1 putative Lipoprotein localization factors LolAB [Thiomonas arsenitoxydans]
MTLSTRRFALRALLLASALLVPTLSQAADWTLDTLMQALARHPANRATFVETKTLAMLDAPIESSGELRFAAPDFLEMRTLKPKRQTLILQANQVTLEMDGRSHQFDLRDHPDVAVLINSIRATLNGDRKALQRDYTTTLDGTAASWELTLSPVDAKARARVRRIQIGGRQGQVQTIAVLQADGDSSLMTIHEQPVQ